jgi:curved DNA-binding protein CbpA
MQQTENPWVMLGVDEDANDQQIRQAYLLKVREYPPDKSPQEFERIREAYECLLDPQRRSKQKLLTAKPDAPLVSILDEDVKKRNFVGSSLWLAALRQAPKAIG